MVWFFCFVFIEEDYDEEGQLGYYELEEEEDVSEEEEDVSGEEEVRL